MPRGPFCLDGFSNVDWHTYFVTFVLAETQISVTIRLGHRKSPVLPTSATLCYNSITLKRFNLILLFAVAWSAITFTLVSADPPDPSAPPDPAIQPFSPPIIAAWLQYTRAVPGPLSVIIAPRVTAYNEVSPHSYTIEADGHLTVNNSVADAVLIDFARLNGIRYLPTISSGWDNGPRLLRIFSDPKLRTDHVNAILNIARQSNVDGIDLDYENLPPEARQPYTDFVTTLAAALHQEGKILSVTVPPKVRADDPCSFCRFADYATLGAVVDRFRVMGYEYHGKSGGPGAIAPVWWMRQVMSYTVSVVPHNKVSLGIHLYGYDWGGADTPALWWNQVQELKKKYDGVVSYPAPDARGSVGESVMTYTISTKMHCPYFIVQCPSLQENHTVWFVDSHYVSETLKIVQDLDLGGIVMWRPGGEDPGIWNILAPTAIASPRFDDLSGF